MDRETTILGPDPLPEEWLARIKPELDPGERLIWAGHARPRRGISGRSFATLYAIGFAVIGVFGLSALFGGFGPRFRVIETALALMGIGGVATSFLIAVGVVGNHIDQWSERKLIAGNLYALTDARAITWGPNSGGVSVHSIRRGTVKTVHRVAFADGSGSVFFDQSLSIVLGQGSGFHEIPDARRVEALVRLHLIGDDRSPSV